MGGRPKSQALHKREAREEKDRLYQEAKALYLNEHSGSPIGPKPMSYREVCQYIIVRNSSRPTAKASSPKDLSSSTLRRLVNRGAPQSQSNKARAWLNNAEEDIVLTFAEEMARRGFPLTHARLKDHVDMICHSKLGPDFPESGVSNNWTTRFVERHCDRLSMYWGHSLDEKRGRAVNPATNKAYFDLLEEVLVGERDDELKVDIGGVTGISEDGLDPDVTECLHYNQDHFFEHDGKPILPENIYAADESSFMPAVGTRLRVVGTTGKKTQQVQGSGNRENTTVIVSICADGTAPKPAVIFKGKAYQVKWLQDNPANALLGYSKKGWTDTEIAVCWLRELNSETEAKANQRTRLLLVDGHNSHYTTKFLLLAISLRIHVLCYPAHGTHVYQGLDVVVFAPLKLYWTQEKDAFERQARQPLGKADFLGVYGRAHLRALTSENIKAAFEKTGVIPFNRGVVTDNMMAPSLETSRQGHLPILPSTPVRLVSNLFQAVHQRTSRRLSTPGLEESQDGTNDEHDLLYTPIQDTINSLRSTSASFLISLSPIQSLSHVASLFTPIEVSPRKQKYADLLNATPVTKLEEQLQTALETMLNKYAQKKDDLLAAQSAWVLNGAYCDAVRSQLQAQEDRASKDKGKKGRLVGDGLPRLLSSRDFVTRVDSFEKAVQNKAEEQTRQRSAREDRSEALAQWKVLEKERKTCNIELRAQWQEDMKQWEEEVRRAKQEKRPSMLERPVVKRLLFPPIPKPRLNAALEENDNAEHSDGSEDNSDSDDETSGSDST